jgi:hypothetical protein
MSNKNETTVISELLHENYSPAAIPDDDDALQCTLSRKMQYSHIEDPRVDPTPMMVFTVAYTVSAKLDVELGSNRTAAAKMFDAMADSLHLHHVAENVTKKYAGIANLDPTANTLLTAVNEHIKAALKALQELGVLSASGNTPEEDIHVT